MSWMTKLTYSERTTSYNNDERDFLNAMYANDVVLMKQLFDTNQIDINCSYLCHGLNNFLQMYVIKNFGYIRLDIFKFLVQSGLDLTNENCEEEQVISMINTFTHKDEMKEIIEVLIESGCDIDNHSCTQDKKTNINLMHFYFVQKRNNLHRGQKFCEILCYVLILILKRGASMNGRPGDQRGNISNHIIVGYSSYLKDNGYKNAAFFHFRGLYFRMCVFSHQIEQQKKIWELELQMKVETMRELEFISHLEWNRKLAFVQFEFALRQFYALRRINNEEDKTHTKLKTEVKTHPKIKCIYAVIVFSNGKFIRHLIKFIK